MKKQALKKALKKNALTALIISGSLAPMLISAIACLGRGIIGYATVNTATVILSVASLLSATAASVIAFLSENRFSAAFFSVIWGLCAVCYLIFMISQTTDVLSDAFFESLMLVVALPVWSYMPLLSGIFGASGQAAGIAAIVISFILMAFNIFSALYMSRKKNTEAEDIAQ